ncbi:MAG: serine/threonine-protein kinase [Polyangiaceae bacterium]
MQVEPGSVVDGKFRVLHKLGEGGMGVVMAADHLQLRSRVAIKLLKREASDKRLERFMREARALAQLQTDHVTRVYDVGSLQSGEPYIVMELLDGEDLSSMGHRLGPLPTSDVADYTMQALVALSEAHAIGIVHRDIKPANLFLASLRDGRRIIKVLDFGISKVNEQAKGRATALTDTGAMLGSPYYMSPEQMKGMRELDARADVWSVGATMHRLLTGRYPFVAGSVAEIAIEILTKPPPPLRQAIPNAPVAFEQLLQRCMSRDPGHRYASVAELAIALAPLGSAESAHALERIRAGLASRGRSMPAKVTEALADHGPTETAQTYAPQVAAVTAETVTPHARASASGVVAPTMDDPSQRASYPGYPPAPHGYAPVSGGYPAPMAPGHTGVAAPSRPARWPWVLGALLLLAGGAGAAAFALSGGDEAGDGSSRSSADDGDASSKKSSKSAGRQVSLKSGVPYYAQASKIADAVEKAHGRALEIYDVLLFEDKARFVVAAEEGGLVRYEVEDGVIADAKPHTLTSASRLDNLLLDRDTLDFRKVPAIAEDAPRRLGKASAETYSVSLHRVSHGVIWVASLTTGESTHYNFAGQPVKR